MRRLSRREIVALARRDLERVGVEPPKCKVRFVAKLDALGIWYPTHEIFLSDDLAGGGLYTVVMHELGHALGLDHTRRGIMAATTDERKYIDRRGPYGSQRRRQAAAIARLVLEKRLREWRAADKID